ncbi:RNA polymerase I-specific transcription initiation factor RRN6-like protein [Xylariomycetidae sp. FL0641]|nr:RNA polymerase I-specific transcription initiation factor RRN6-like protein [Xylariomycetidae sp. FL0641]
MTERHIESCIGLAGRLSYTPLGTGRAEDCGWHSTRTFAENASTFEELGPCKTWYPATSSRDQHAPSRTASKQTFTQERWLLKNHPEAFLGNEVLHELLLEANQSNQSPSAQSWPSHLALGELTDTSDPQRSIGVPLIATSTGSANHVLRLSKLDTTDWKWSEDGKATLQLSEMGSEEPAFWDQDAGPINQIKCIVDSKRYEPTRWLIVQRPSGTRVFQPEYRKTLDNPPGSGSEEPSHIAANPIFRLSKDQTGGSSHTDAAFNPGTRSRSPQVSIIDERGFWSIWDITRTRSSGKPKPKLTQCGHIEQGILEQLPYRSKGERRWHKIFWVGSSRDLSDELDMLDVEEESFESYQQTSSPPLRRSSLLLLCNPRTVRLLDLLTGSFMPDLSFLRQDGLDQVLDVQVNLLDPQYVYVLTSSNLFVVRTSSTPGLDWDKPQSQWSILLSSPHFRDVFDRSLNLVIAPGARSPKQNTTVAFIHSTENAWLDLFCINHSTSDPDRVTFHRQAVDMSSSEDALFVQALRLLPAKVSVQPSADDPGTAHDLIRQRVRFHQLVVLRSDSSVISTLCATSTLPLAKMNIIQPCLNVTQPPNTSRERRRLIRHLAYRFVVADEPYRLNLQTTPRLGPGTKGADDRLRPAQRFVQLFYEKLSNDWKAMARNDAASDGEHGPNPFEAVHMTVEEAFGKGSLPATTLLEMMQGPETVGYVHNASSVWAKEMERLQVLDPSVALLGMEQLRISQPISLASTLPEIQDKLGDFFGTPSPADGTAMLGRLACDLYLSAYVLLHPKPLTTQPARLLSPFPSSVHGEEMPVGSRPDSYATSSYRSETPESVASSQRPKWEKVEEEDAAMALLRTYTGTGKFVPQKQTELLDKWQMGADPADYVFDLDRSREKTAGMLRVAKQLARESRKRRRAETLLQKSREPELPSTQPAPETRFFSSQVTQPPTSQLIHSDPPQIMSQPFGGAFGRRDDRPKKKVKKRKGGF